MAILFEPQRPSRVVKTPHVAVKMAIHSLVPLPERHVLVLVPYFGDTGKNKTVKFPSDLREIKHSGGYVAVGNVFF